MSASPTEMREATAVEMRTVEGGSEILPLGSEVENGPKPTTGFSDRKPIVRPTVINLNNVTSKSKA